MLVGSLMLATLVLALAPLQAQQSSGAADQAASAAATSAAPQPLDLNEAIARDVLEPMRAGIESQNLKQVLSLFDPDSFPNFAQFRDQLRSFLDSYSAVRFRYKIMQASATEDGRASVTCEADIDTAPLDSGQVPLRRNAQIQLQLKHMPKGWRIAGLTPNDFFVQ
jgi:hypothetical protein